MSNNRHLMIGVPLVGGTLLGMFLLVKLREQFYASPQFGLQSYIRETTKRVSKEDAVEQFRKELEKYGQFDYNMKPVK